MDAVSVILIMDGPNTETSVNNPDASAKDVMHVTRINVFIANMDMTFTMENVTSVVRTIVMIYPKNTFVNAQRKEFVTIQASVTATLTMDTKTITDVEFAAWAVNGVQSKITAYPTVKGVRKDTLGGGICHIFVSSFKTTKAHFQWDPYYGKDSCSATCSSSNYSFLTCLTQLQILQKKDGATVGTTDGEVLHAGMSLSEMDRIVAILFIMILVVCGSMENTIT
jgi:hypothetical protein